MVTVFISSTGTTQRQNLVKAVVVVDRLILAHLRHHRVRVANHAAAVAALDRLQSQVKAEVLGAHTVASLERVVPPAVVI